MRHLLAFVPEWKVKGPDDVRAGAFPAANVVGAGLKRGSGTLDAGALLSCGRFGKPMLLGVAATEVIA